MGDPTRRGEEAARVQAVARHAEVVDRAVGRRPLEARDRESGRHVDESEVADLGAVELRERAAGVDGAWHGAGEQRLHLAVESGDHGGAHLAGRLVEHEDVRPRQLDVGTARGHPGKFPPTTIWSPTSANAHTAPSRTIGFCVGTSDTTLSCPGGVVAAATASGRARLRRVRRRGRCPRSREADGETEQGEEGSRDSNRRTSRMCEFP